MTTARAASTASAQLSACRTYRYSLTRRWDESLPWMTFIGLNPSTADETADDPTIRKIIGYAKREGYGGLIMLNLFAFRATDPKEMMKAADPVGPDNDNYLGDHMETAGLVICGWGAGGSFMNRGNDVRRMLGSVNAKAFGLTKNGNPKHPLYLRGDCPLVRL